MKPQRMAMTHQLVLGYGLQQHLQVYVSWALGESVGALCWIQGCILGGQGKGRGMEFTQPAGGAADNPALEAALEAAWEAALEVLQI